MNKNLLTLAGILSLLVANQVWCYSIKNETAIKQKGHTKMAFPCTAKDSFDLNTGEIKHFSNGACFGVSEIWLGNNLVYARKETDKAPHRVNFTIKTDSYGKTVIVEHK